MSAFSVAITLISARKMSAPVQPARGAHDVAVGQHLDLGAELAQGVDVGVDRAAADLVAARGRQLDPAGARQQWPGQHEAGAHAPANLGRGRRLAQVAGAHATWPRPAARPWRPGPAGRPASCARPGSRDVLERHRLVGQQRRRQHGQRRVLVARDRDLARERLAAFDDEAVHRASLRQLGRRRPRRMRQGTACPGCWRCHTSWRTGIGPEDGRPESTSSTVPLKRGPAMHPSPDVTRLIARLPMVELHLHLEGTLEPELAFELAARNGRKLGHADVKHTCEPRMTSVISSLSWTSITRLAACCVRNRTSLT